MILGALVTAGCTPRSGSSEWGRRGRVLAWGDVDHKRVEGTTWVEPESVPEVSTALAGYLTKPLQDAVRGAPLDGLWFRPSLGASVGPDTPLASRFGAIAFVPGFAAQVITRDGVLYAPDPRELANELADRVLAKVARRLLQGAEPPPPSSFPAAFRTPDSVEVLVLLREFGQVRLWRSARTGSIADGVVRASVAAAERWRQRQGAMGGPLEERLPLLDVEVAILIDDGTLVEKSPTFIDRAVTPRHGVGYEQPGRWRYLLPRATLRAGSPSKAFRQLFRDNDLPEDSFTRPDLRLYRFVMQTLSVDQASAGKPSSSDATGASPSSAALSLNVGGSP